MVRTHGFKSHDLPKRKQALNSYLFWSQANFAKLVQLYFIVYCFGGGGENGKYCIAFGVGFEHTLSEF